MSDSRLDIERQKMEEDKARMHFVRMDYCDKHCYEHNEQCPYYDSEQEVWDYEECFRDKGW